MNDNLNKIRARIRALSDKTASNGCTEAEAMSAMAMVSRLLNDYNLSMSECDVQAEDAIQRNFKFTTAVQLVGGGLLVTIAAFCGVKVWLSPVVVRTGTINRVSGNPRIKRVVDGCCFFGFEQDILMAEYLYNTLNSAIGCEIQAFKYSETYRHAQIARKSLTTSFEHGMNNRLIQRLNQLKVQMQDETVSAGKNALVVVKDQTVERAYAAATQHLKLRSSTTTRTIRSGDAYLDGHAAGDRVNLNRPLNAGSQQSRLV